jgi:hypothetical protein
MKPFACPYDNESCGFVDTEAMIQTQGCENCPRYGDGVRLTGAMPTKGLLSEIKDLIKKLLK